ncbi:hypothetical protein RSOLAG22IIIB_12618 [Rhizoctonia solani]|uniref:Uncharacterized protein n=1 Tax=Rhizoctonia solani TaxID=456999 RepID=A0A0K6GFQ4_9AGAM|nr:hypothetical protein RSOLAG22IIIB_12618 [Rhizoctonia solani]
MTLPSGNYRVATGDGQQALFIRPPGLIGTPVETIVNDMPPITVIHVEQRGDRYVLTRVEDPRGFPGAPVIGSTGLNPQPGQKVEIVPSGAPDIITEWRIEPLEHPPGTQNVYRIRPADETGIGGLSWSATGEAQPVVLIDFRGEIGQNWIFDAVAD